LACSAFGAKNGEICAAIDGDRATRAAVAETRVVQNT
jgi:hypothetical protein